MFLFYPAPICFDSYTWSSPTACTITPETEEDDDNYYDDTNKDYWRPFTKYGEKAVVKRGQYVYYSTKKNNEDDPFFNYLGFDPTTASASGDPSWDFNVGKNSWIRGRCLHDYDCINYASPGYTQRNTDFTVKIFPYQMGRPRDFLDVARSANMPSYWILSGVRAGSVTVQNYDVNGNPVGEARTFVQKEKTPWLYATDGSRRICKNVGTPIIPELPYVLNDLLIVPRRVNFNADPVNQIGTSFTFHPTDYNGDNYDIIGVQSILLGYVTNLGMVHSDAFSVGAIDYSRVNYDDWGKMTLMRGKRAKTMKVTLTLGGHNFYAQALTRKEYILRIIEACRATPAGFLARNDSYVTEKFISSLFYIQGLVKSVTLEEPNSQIAKLTLQIEGMPTDYNP